MKRLAVLLMLSVWSTCRADLQVWTRTTTERVLREDPAGEGVEVTLAAARNEWESFQILVRADEAVQGISLQAGDLAGPGGATLPASAARRRRAPSSDRR